MRHGSAMSMVVAGAVLAGGCAHVPAPMVDNAPVSIERAIIRASEGQSGIDVAAYAVFLNRGEEDAVFAADCSCAAQVELHIVRGEAGQRQMATDWPLALPASSRTEVAPGSPRHFMLIGITTPITAGKSHRLRFHLRSGRTVTAEFIGVANSLEAWQSASEAG